MICKNKLQYPLGYNVPKTAKFFIKKAAEQILNQGVVPVYEMSEGHVIVVPVAHYENVYELPEDIGARIFSVAKEFSLKMKQAYGCDGVNLLQNNEPAAGQHAFHYHLHLFPRYEGDNLWQHMGEKRKTTVQERLKFVQLFE